MDNIYHRKRPLNSAKDGRDRRQRLRGKNMQCASLASLTRESGPKVVKGDPARKTETPKVSHQHQQHHYFCPTISVSDSSLKFTHVLYNLSPGELYEQAIKNEHGSFITASGALATLSGAKTGRSPRDKRVVKDETTAENGESQSFPYHTLLVVYTSFRYFIY